MSHEDREPQSVMISVLIRRERDTRDMISMHREKAFWGHSKNPAICKPSRETSEETIPAKFLILNFQPPEEWENKLLFKTLSLWNFVMAALEN